MTVDYPQAIAMFVPSAKVFTGADPGHRNPSIVIHKTAGFSTIEQLGAFFGSLTETDASSHYGVGLDGRVAQFVSESDGAGGNCCLEAGHDTYWDQWAYGDQMTNLNLVTFSIEHIDPATDNSTTPTQAQLDASFTLVLYLCKKYNITSDRIKPHSSLDPISRARCPGNYPMWELLARIQEKLMIPTGWHDDGTTLTAPNGHKVVGGFRQYILSNPWIGANVPLEEEYAKTPVEEFYPSDPGTWQTFNYSALAWTSKRGVYVPGIGNEFIGLEKARASLEQKLQNPPVGSVADIEDELSILEDNITIIRAKLGVSGP
jgi:N-acetyl-anhydromuramyl-L-alanine amidase AmpD